MAALRMLAWRGGIALTVRQIVGMAISFAGLIGLARLIGPADYGIYVSALAMHTFLVVFFQWGTDVFLLRRPQDPAPDHIHQAFTLSLALGLLGVALAWPAGILAERWIGTPGVAKAVTALFCGMPLPLAAQVPSAVLQRQMAYRRVAQAELAGHVALYAAGLSAAFAGLGLAAPLIGWWAQQVVLAFFFFRLAGYRPRLVWRRALLAELLSYGLGYSAAGWVWQVRTLANPLIVARFLGPEAAASVAVASRLVESLSFMRLVLWRVALPALARLQGDKARLAHAVGEGARFQVLAVAPAIAGFALAAPVVVPLAFGKDWTPVVAVFPFLALASLVNSMLSLHSSALYVLGRNREVALFHAANVLVLAVAGLTLVPHWGLTGYGLSEAAALVTYLLLRRAAQKVLGRIDLWLPATWALAFALPLFADRIGPAAWAAPPAVLLLPATRRTLAAWWGQVKEAAFG